MKINLHIERVVLDGLSIKPHQQRPLKVAMESELTRLLSAEPVGSGLQSSRFIQSVSGDTTSISGNAQPRVLGAQIAGTVHRGIGK